MSSLISKSQAIDDGRLEEFLHLFSNAPHQARPPEEHFGLWPALLWTRMVQPPFPRPTEFWVSHDGRHRIGANLSLTRPDIGYIGFFENHGDEPEMGKSLLKEAIQFLRKSGAKEIYGPLNFNTWFPYRFGLPHQDDLKFSWEPMQPKHYVTLWTEMGFEECERYQSVGLTDLQSYINKTRMDYERCLQKGFTFRTLNPSELETKEIPMLYRLSMEGFRQNFLFEPLDLKGFSEIYVPAMKNADLTYTFVALDAQGDEVGFFYGFADQGYVILKTVAVADRARGQGVSNALTHLQVKKAMENGLQGMATALVKSGAQSESYQKKATPVWKHDYALYRLKN